MKLARLRNCTEKDADEAILVNEIFQIKEEMIWNFLAVLKFVSLLYETMTTKTSGLYTVRNDIIAKS